MNKFDFTEDHRLVLNGMTSEPVSEEIVAMCERIRQFAKDREFKIILTTNPLAPLPKEVDDQILMPMYEPLPSREADFILSMGKLTNDVDGHYGLTCVKARVPSTENWEVREDGREVLTGRDLVLSYIPGENEDPRTFVTYWGAGDNAEQTED